MYIRKIQIPLFFSAGENISSPKDLVDPVFLIDGVCYYIEYAHKEKDLLSTYGRELCVDKSQLRKGVGEGGGGPSGQTENFKPA